MIDKKEVRHIADLARLHIGKEEGKFRKDLSFILAYFESLKESDTGGVEPTFHPTEKFFKKINVAREDKEAPWPEDYVKKLLPQLPTNRTATLRLKRFFNLWNWPN